MVNTDVSIQHVGARVYVQTLKDIWKYLNIIEASLNLELKQVRLPSNNYLFFMNTISYKTIGEYYIVISLQILNLKTSI